MTEERLRSLLSQIYGPGTAESVAGDLQPVLDKYRGNMPAPRASGWSERDAMLITYADQVQGAGTRPLASLGDFCQHHLEGFISGIHVLPFYPWSSDDGFAVIDYKAVAEQYGAWNDVRRLGAYFRLMFDAVINHASAESEWFQAFLRREPAYRDFFIEVRGDPDLSKVVRPRALPLLTEFRQDHDTIKLWTTFSPDQIDLNYHNPRVLLSVLDVLLFYASQGAEFVRLDAIAYLWKEPGTSCISLPQTHWIVQVLRAVLDEVAPHVMLITETNVPNLENLSYFGDGTNEAQLVYNFPLPPLVLHAMHTGDAHFLAAWASGLQLPSDRVTFLNFLASHDGIGLNPARGILPESEIDAMVRRIESRGGYISRKTDLTGGEIPYELNVNYLDALDDAEFEVGSDLQLERFVTAHAILLSFMGVPAIYFHSLFGSRGWPEGVRQTGKPRSINRQKLQRADLENDLADEDSLRSRVFRRLCHLLAVRRSSACFSPHASQGVIEAPNPVFALLREAPGAGSALCVHNVSHLGQDVRLNLSATSLGAVPRLHDLIAGRQVAGGPKLALTLGPYESLWLIG